MLRAFSLLNELVQVYRQITVEQFTVEQQRQQKAWSVASEILEKVFVWQHSCIRESLKKVPDAGAVSPVKGESPVFDVKGLLGAVRQEIAATGMLAIRESAALLELVHVQKEKTALASADSAGADEFSSVVRKNIFSLEQTLHQEMGRLRHEFVRD